MKKLALLLFACTLAGKSFGQNDFARAAMDSLQKILSTQKTAHDSLLTVQKMVDFTPVRADETNVYGDHYKLLFILNRKLKLIDTIPYGLMQRGNTLWHQRKYEESLVAFQQAVELFDKQHKVIYPLLLNMRILYNYINNQNDRLHYYEKKLEYYLVNGPYENTAPCYHGIAGYYLYKGAFNQSINNYMQGAAVFRRFNPHFYANATFVIGMTYDQWGNYDKAEDYANQALPLSKSLNDSASTNYSYLTLSHIAFSREKYEKALSLAKQSLHYIRKQPSQRVAFTLSLQAGIYLKLGQPDTAFAYLEKARKMSDSLGFKLVSSVGYTEIDYNYYFYYKAKGNMDKAERSLLLASQKATNEKGVPLSLKYLRELSSFYRQQGKPELSEKYAAAYFTAYDAYEKSRGDFKIAQYAIDQNDREQRDHIAQLKQEKVLQDYELNRRNILLIASFGVILLIVFLLAFIYKQLVVNKKTLISLRQTQRQLIQSEKMASLGELTAGIAHEIQNPLNFVNNFSEVSVELIEEMETELKLGQIDDALEIAEDVKQNLEKIRHHGKRADGIVKGMLQHSRASSNQKEPTDINELADEYLRLAYHGLRAKDKSFNADLATNFADTLPKVQAVPQDIGRVILNMLNNAFYAIQQKAKTAGPDYKPVVEVKTLSDKSHVTITIKDNGSGIPDSVKEKIMQPFFTTKPTGEGTGLGLSLSYDIIVKGHNGRINIESKEGEGSEFIIDLPIV